MSDVRYFVNKFGDAIDENYESTISQAIFRMEKEISSFIAGISQSINDSSIYVGSSGIAFMFWHISRRSKLPLERKYCLGRAEDIVSLRHTLDKADRRTATFVLGSVGPMTLLTLLGKSNYCGDIMKIALNAVKQHQTADEVLYGRAGILSALLLLRSHGYVETDGVIRECVSAILHSGEIGCREKNFGCPLMYNWHGEYYLGAAHGITGIIYYLLKAYRMSETYFTGCYGNAVNALIKPTVDWLVTLRFSSGNYPAAIERDPRDNLVHWCHGAPGWIYMFIECYLIFNDQKYLELAAQCCEVIWKRGILKKGYGICHGTAGNGYAFLAMFRVTRDDRYLRMAQQFALWCSDYGKHNCRRADNPYSLYEGLAGTLCYLCDVLNPSESAFPGFEV